MCPNSYHTLVALPFRAQVISAARTVAVTAAPEELFYFL